ncbi:family 1 glycosylhydrolase [Runella slithyformis]|uniref:dTDP-4-dehydrorhamnose reductase n=1 Tax=Runella slithyformis (strain ATCC 29530 / DSM 19594 / LMG 11500 / NCIMB 11436 / LSU 4) TaxID=761193 RepID=A0A7U3ZRX2_RUNSL|nr:family 1 glycosylhydrolase [Runella slithyformis]AEI52222.1 dTDP-4-dehydrorhamnose reductase [Runella slithyformis DSM 19594]
MVAKKSTFAIPDVWAGIECSFNRIGDSFSDQLVFSGHYERADDIDQFAELGIKALHYPILWELHQPQKESVIQWDWIAAQLQKIQSHSITPIIGLLHHGSGPAYTHLLDDDFATGLSSFAKKVATRFPELTHYKPINEPLTTARFSGLYGLWHPHAREDVIFAKILLNQLKAIVLSMEEIRKINPEAKLIQTEDLSKTYSTPLLQYQADFENHRRWLTYDILMGKLDRQHPLWSYFIGLGFSEKSLLFFQERPCIPDLLGVNHYVTSERFLDDDLSRYPTHMHGGNGRHAYVDVEAIRVNHPHKAGLKVLLEELRDRYPAIDIALTEVHLHCTREEQLRWLKHTWDTCVELNAQGANIKALTVWALLGAFGWNKLLTQPGGDYESGIFDLRSPSPRPTALAALVKALSNGCDFQHPVLKQKGWWEKESRFIHPLPHREKVFDFLPPTQPLLVIGKNGTLGRAFGLLCQQRGIKYRLLSRQELDICDMQSIEAVFKSYRPWAVVNAAGYARIDSAELEPQKCFNDNVTGVKNLTQACKMWGVKLLTFSSSMVFDGMKTSPYLESDLVSPLNTYGRSKVEAEKAVLEADCRALVIRTSLIFSPWDHLNFVGQIVTSLNRDEPLVCPKNVFISPTYLPDLVHTALDLLIDDEIGIWHLTNQGEVNWAEFASDIARRTGNDTTLINRLSPERMAWKAPRPYYSVLGSEKGIFLPPLTHALDRYFMEKAG